MNATISQTFCCEINYYAGKLIIFAQLLPQIHRNF